MKMLMQSAAGAVTEISGRLYDYYCGCGYLGLQNHPQVIAAAGDALARYGLSTATSRGGYGEHPLYDELEKSANAFFNSERLLYFASGYMGAAILVQTDLHPQDHFFVDAAGHFSLWDAASMSNRPVTPFRHLDPGALADCLQLELQTGEQPVVLTDGLFPISGEIAPLPDYRELLRPLNGRLIVDDAHAVGVLGEHGRGTLEHFGIQDENCRSCGTFNKALGGYGGFICGETGFINFLEQNSRIFIGSSPPPLPAAAASARGLQVIRSTPELLTHLRANIRQARTGLRELGWNLPDSPSPILCLPGRDGINLLKIRATLFEQKIAIEYVHNYPSTPAGGALRIALFATHTPQQVARLIEAISQLL